MADEADTRTLGELVKARELSPKDIKALCDGKTTFLLSGESHGLVRPEWRDL